MHKNLLEKAFSISDLSKKPEFNPALLTFNEYKKVLNYKDEYHDDRAWKDTTISSFQHNEYEDKTKNDFPRLLRQATLHGRKLEFRYGYPFEKDSGVIAVFDENQIIAAYQDEWNCVLIRVAKEYRNFGIGAILGHLVRQIEPTKTSGGFTQSGIDNARRYYRKFVSDALSSGLYTRMLKNKEITLDRVKEIIKSAKLDARQNHEQKDLSNTTPDKWMLYTGGYGDFTLYDRRLKDHYNSIYSNDVNDFWISKFMLGTVLVRALKDKDSIIVLFGGETDKIKRFMMTCALAWCFDEGLTLHVDQEDIAFVSPEFGNIGEASNRVTGHNRCPVQPLKSFPIDDFKQHEEMFRKTFDQHDEFKNSVQEIAYGKFRHH